MTSGATLGGQVDRAGDLGEQVLEAGDLLDQVRQQGEERAADDHAGRLRSPPTTVMITKTSARLKFHALGRDERVVVGDQRPGRGRRTRPRRRTRTAWPGAR